MQDSSRVILAIVPVSSPAKNDYELDKKLVSMHNAHMSHAQSAQLSSTVCFIRAYAKINLTLDVLGRRTDGYHELATIMQTVDLYDTICSDSQRRPASSLCLLNCCIEQ